MNWISIKDRVPPFGEQVLAYCPIYGVFIASYEFIVEFESVKYGNWSDGRDLGILPPTHWQPIPQRPPNNCTTQASSIEALKSIFGLDKEIDTKQTEK